MARRALFVLLAGLLPLVVVAPAGAVTYFDDWWLSARGSSHCRHANDGWGRQLACDRQGAPGQYTWGAVDAWLPWFCNVVWVAGGDGVGTPQRIYVEPPAGASVGCYPGYGQSQLQGWRTGTGTYEGQFISAGWANRNVYYVAGRDPASPNAYGTIIEVF